MSPLLPMSLPFWTAELPAAGGELGPAPEDFVVDELPLYEPVGEGEHLYVRIEKRGHTTHEVIDAIARAAGVHPRDVGSAGMKDKHAITRQWLSLPQRASEPGSWRLPDGLTVLAVSRHKNKLRTGHLAGNRFEIRLRGVDEGAAVRAAAILRAIGQRGIPNYYAEQRFGRGAGNLQAALDWLRRGAPSGGPRGRFLNKLFPSVIQAEIFNRYVSARLGLGLDRLVDGEVVRLHGSGASFVVDDVQREQARYEAGELHLTGPMPGPRTKAAERAAAALEAAAVDAVGLGEADLGALARWAEGTRRDVMLLPDALTLHEEPGALVLSFALPPGGYATLVARELTRRDRLPKESESA